VRAAVLGVPLGRHAQVHARNAEGVEQASLDCSDDAQYAATKAFATGVLQVPVVALDGVATVDRVKPFSGAVELALGQGQLEGLEGLVLLGADAAGYWGLRGEQGFRVTASRLNHGKPTGGALNQLRRPSNAERYRAYIAGRRPPPGHDQKPLAPLDLEVLGNGYCVPVGTRVL
jgi:hypothetical protein